MKSGGAFPPYGLLLKARRVNEVPRESHVPVCEYKNASTFVMSVVLFMYTPNAEIVLAVACHGFAVAWILFSRVALKPKSRPRTIIRIHTHTHLCIQTHGNGVFCSLVFRDVESAKPTEQSDHGAIA